MCTSMETQIGIRLASCPLQILNLLLSGPLYTLKNLRLPKNFCLCEFYLLIFTLLEIENGKMFKYLFKNNMPITT